MIRFNAQELLNDLLSAGMSKEEAWEGVREETRKRKEACIKGEKIHREYVAKEQENRVNFR